MEGPADAEETGGRDPPRSPPRSGRGPHRGNGRPRRMGLGDRNPRDQSRNPRGHERSRRHRRGQHRHRSRGHHQGHALDVRPPRERRNDQDPRPEDALRLLPLPAIGPGPCPDRAVHPPRHPPDLKQTALPA